jgi:hypothetical protein
LKQLVADADIEVREAKDVSRGVVDKFRFMVMKRRLLVVVLDFFDDKNVIKEELNLQT